MNTLFAKQRAAPRIVLPTVIACTPEALLPEIGCLLCGTSKQQLLASFDAFLCAALLQSDCTLSALLPLGAPYLVFSPRELSAASTYLWLAFLTEEAPPGTPLEESDITKAASPFLGRSELEILAMQLYLLCKMTQFNCTAADLLNLGRCYCASLKELLAIRFYLLSLFVGNFARVETDPTAVQALIAANAPSTSVSELEAGTVWMMCQLYDIAIEAPPLT